MEFREARDIAKQHPGSTVTRDASGSFVVRLENGTVIRSSGQPHSDSEASLKMEIADLRSEVRALEKKCSELESTVDFANRKSTEQWSEIRKLRSENEDLRSKLSKVSSSEWARIEEAEKLEAVKRQKDEQERIMSLVRNHALSYERLRLILDNSAKFEFSKDDLDAINWELERTRPQGVSDDSLVVFSTTDGQ